MNSIRLFERVVTAALIAVFVLGEGFGSAAFSQISANGLGTKTVQSGSTISITEGLRPNQAGPSTCHGCAIPGPNVFHSFDTFNLAAGETANFVRPTEYTFRYCPDCYPQEPGQMITVPAPKNVISRVTGGPSLIEGMLQALGWEGFYFINPHGVVFGPSAKINISGSVYISTADRVNLSDRGFMNAISNEGHFSDQLTIGRVSSFGFSSNYANPMKIEIKQSELVGSQGQIISLIAGDIDITGGKIEAPGGRVQLTSVGKDFKTRQKVGYGGEVDVGGRITIGTDGSLSSTPEAKGNIQLTHFQEPVKDTELIAGRAIETKGEITYQSDKVDSVRVARLPDSHIRVTAPIVSSLKPELLLDIDETGKVTGTLKDPYTTAVTIELQSEKSGVAAPTKTSVTVPADNQTFEFEAKGLTEGTTAVTATVQAKQKNPIAKVPVTVRLPVGFQGLKGPEILDIGDRGTYTITLDQPGRQGTFVDLLSDESGVVKLLSSEPINMEGKTTADIGVEALMKGETNIRVQLRNSTKIASARVRVDERLSVQTLRAPALLDEGAKDFITVKLNRPDESPVFVELLTTSSNGSVTLETKTIRIDQNTDTSRPIQIIGEQAGDVRITARLQNTSVESNATVKVQAIPIESLSPDLAIKEDQTSTLNVTLARETQRAIRIDLENSAPLVVTVDPFVTVEPGTRSATVPVVGLKDGVATIKATGRAGQDTAIVQVTLLDPPPLSGVGPDLKINVRSSSSGDSIVVSLAEPFKRDVPIRLSSSDPNIATVGDVTIIPAGKTSSSPVQVAGHKVGQVIITAASSTSSAQAQINVGIPTTARGTIDLASSVQYPRIVATPQATIGVPRLLAGRCAGSKDSQFSSFAQLNRDSAPPQPGRYLSSPTLLENEAVVGGQGAIPEISFMVGPPKLLTVKPESMVFTMLTENCGR